MIHECVTIQHSCGHEAPYEDFQKTTIGGDLPKDHFQCPKCNQAWKIERGKPRVLKSGFIMPGDNTIKPTNSAL